MDTRPAAAGRLPRDAADEPGARRDADRAPARRARPRGPPAGPRARSAIMTCGSRTARSPPARRARWCTPTKSHHHQGVSVIGDGFQVTGWATVDELPEAIEDPSKALRARRAMASGGRSGRPGDRGAGGGGARMNRLDGQGLRHHRRRRRDRRGGGRAVPRRGRDRRRRGPARRLRGRRPRAGRRRGLRGRRDRVHAPRAVRVRPHRRALQQRGHLPRRRRVRARHVAGGVAARAGRQPAQRLPVLQARHPAPARTAAAAR